MEKDVQMRKAQITINNPETYGFNHDRIKEALSKIKPCIYWIMGDEIGGKNSTEHTHIYAVFKTPVRFSTLKNRFPIGHIEKAYGSHQANIEYVCKTGKWKDTEKGTTSIPDTIETWGECPKDGGNGTDQHLLLLYQYIQDGLSNYEILQRSADYLFDTDKIDRVRLIIKQEEFKTTWRELEVTYIFGDTGAGKSRYVMEKYGYENVFRVTDYTHPFDTYKGEDVVVWEEFFSSFRIQDCLNYADGYPLKLPARYSDKIACYTKLYICTNIPLEKQYPNVQEESPETWKAFIRRIKKIMWFREQGVATFDSTEDYFRRNEKFHSISQEEQLELPFNN